MTGLLKYIAVGAVTAFSALTALRLSGIKKNLKTRIGLPSKLEVIRAMVRLTLPVTLYNYTGFTLTVKRLRIEVAYTPEGGTETLLAVSPAITQKLTLKKDQVSTPSFQIDIDPTALFSLKRTTPIIVTVKFDFGFLPIEIPQTISLADFIPTALNDSINTTVNSLLQKLGLGQPALGCACQTTPVLPPYNVVKTLSGIPVTPLTTVL